MVIIFLKFKHMFFFKGLPSLFCFRLSRKKLRAVNKLKLTLQPIEPQLCNSEFEEGFSAVSYMYELYLNVNHRTLLQCSSWPYVLFCNSIRPYCYIGIKNKMPIAIRATRSIACPVLKGHIELSIVVFLEH